MRCLRCYEGLEFTMARKCMVSGKTPKRANKVCFSNKKFRYQQAPNLQWKRFWVPELGRFLRLRVTTRVIKLATKVGLVAALARNNMTLAQAMSK